MIIFRYLLRELFVTFLLTTIVLTFIFVSTQLAHYLTLTAAGKIVSWQLFYLLLLEMPQLLALILPLAFYLSILLAYGRLYSDHEMVVLSASGVSRQKLLSMTVVPAIIVAIAVALMTLWLNPEIAVSRNALLNRISATSALQSLLPGQFQSLDNGRKVFYIRHINRHQQLQNIFFAQQQGVDPLTHSPSWAITTASTGYYDIQPRTHAHFIIADQGNRYQKNMNSGDFTIIHFKQYGYRIDAPLAVIGENPIDNVATWQLWRAKAALKLRALAELQWRISLPLSTVVLTFLGFALIQVSPRQSRFSRFFPAILIYIVYANGMIIGQSWIIQGKLSPYWGLALLHIGVLTIAFSLYRRQRQ